MATETAQLRRELIARFSATCEAELARPGTRAVPDGWPALSLPAALRETLVNVALLDGAERRAPGGCPEPLVAHYTRLMPARLVAQLFRDGPPGQELLWRPLELARLPRLHAALDGLFAALAGAGLDGEAMVGAPSPGALVARRPTVAALYSATLFGTGLPLLGAFPEELVVVAADLAAGRDPDAVIDHRLAGNLVHELCHGPARETLSRPVPWLLLEAAALHLGAAARRAHIFPDEEGEAVPGVSLFVLVGEALARRFGRRALWSILGGTAPSDALGARAACALEVAGWQDWQRRRAPPFVHDALDAFDVIKLIDATRPGSPLDALIERATAEDRLTATGTEAISGLVSAARAVPWPALPWWDEPAGPADDAMVETAVRALFSVHRMAPNFQTHPSEAPGARLHLDVAGCVLSAEPRPDGIFGEPARWLFPPSLARRIAARGAVRVRIEGATRARAGAVAERLRELGHGGGALDREVILDCAGARPPAVLPAAPADVFSTVMAAGRGFFRDAAAFAAHQLGVFAAFGGGPEVRLGAAELARTIGVAPRRLSALLDVLALEGALVRDGDRFRRGVVPKATAVVADGWGRIAEVIRADRPLGDSDDPESRRRFHRHLVDAGAAAARDLAERFAARLAGGLLFDAGGGAGGYTAALLTAAPTARAILVDRPEVIELARVELRRFGDRVRFVAGDLLTVDARALGPARLVLLANVLHLHGPATCALLVARLADALAPSGRLVVTDLDVAADRSGPPAGLLFALNMALYTDEGDVHDRGRISDWLERAGLVDIRCEAAPEALLVSGTKR